MGSVCLEALSVTLQDDLHLVHYTPEYIYIIPNYVDVVLSISLSEERMLICGPSISVYSLCDINSTVLMLSDITSCYLPTSSIFSKLAAVAHVFVQRIFTV